MHRVLGLAAILLLMAFQAQAACTVNQAPSSSFSSAARLDTMAGDQAKITGGCIDNVPIGQNTPSAGAFTTLTTNGNNVGSMLCQSAAGVSHTGDTNEFTFATCTVPANAMGINGRLQITSIWSATNNANNKQARMRFSGASGTIYGSATITTQVSLYCPLVEIANRAAANSQVGTSACASFSGTAVTSAVDTTAATTVVLTGQLGTGTDTITLESYAVRVVPGS